MADTKPTHPTKITFSSPGACPPVFVAGSFTTPQWQPYELEYSIVANKDPSDSDRPNYLFFRTFSLPEGTFQYKFRLGYEGDWWVCDQNMDIGGRMTLFRRRRLTCFTVTDPLGNQNNRLVVLPPSQSPSGSIRKRKDESGHSSVALSEEPRAPPESIQRPTQSTLRRILEWFKSILILLFYRKTN